MNFDARTLSREALSDLRRRGVASVQNGQTPDEVAQALCVSRAAVFNWLAMYRAGGWKALEARTRGGRPRKLDGRQMRWVYRTVAGKSPLQLRFSFALWTLNMIRIVIRRQFGIQLSRSSVGRLMEQLGISAQRPLWRAYQQNPKAVSKWLKEEYPRICAEAKRRGALVFFGDEAGAMALTGMDPPVLTKMDPGGCADRDRAGVLTGMEPVRSALIGQTQGVCRGKESSSYRWTRTRVLGKTRTCPTRSVS